MNNAINKRLLGAICILCICSLFLFLGQTEFNTHGEPREALVGYAMVQDGNWTLPVTNGVDMAYKPPLFHWCIAAISTFAGEVTEYTSRMPSAIALSFMVIAGFLFYAKRRGAEVAFLTGLITLTNFEVHRAGVNCRVDMLLAAMMVMALYQLYKWSEKQLKGIPWTAILFLSGAALTKGPIGIALPCLVAGLYLWIRGYRFIRLFATFVLVGLAACIIPMLWYVAAWKQGGDAFLQLVLEENVLRLLGKMTYESHEQPLHYNFITVLSGYVPYTLLVLFSLFTLKYSKLSGKPAEWWKRFKTYIAEMDDTRLYSLLSIVVIFVFYCIPKSKRSVYLLPIYPFIAYFLAEYILYLVRHQSKAIKLYATVLSSLSLLLALAFVGIKCGLVPENIFQGKHAAQNIAFLNALVNLPLSAGNLLIILLPVLTALYYFIKLKRGINQRGAIYCSIAVTYFLFMALDGVYQPAILKVKSNKWVAERIKELVPEGPVYSYITLTPAGNRSHPFNINFYLGNRVIPFIENQPKKGYLLLDKEEYDGFMNQYGANYILEKTNIAPYKSADNKKLTQVYRFELKQAE